MDAILLSIILLFLLVPASIDNWKVLICCNILTLAVFSYVIYICIYYAGDAPAAAGGLFLIALLVLLISFLTSAFKAFEILSGKGVSFRALMGHVAASLIGGVAIVIGAAVTFLGSIFVAQIFI